MIDNRLALLRLTAEFS